MNKAKLKVTIRVADEPPRSTEDGAQKRQSHTVSAVCNGGLQCKPNTLAEPVCSSNAKWNKSSQGGRRVNADVLFGGNKYNEYNLGERPEAFNTSFNSDRRLNDASFLKNLNAASCCVDGHKHYAVEIPTNNPISLLNINKPRRHIAVDKVVAEEESFCEDTNIPSLVSAPPSTTKLDHIARQTTTNPTTAGKLDSSCLNNDLLVKESFGKPSNGYKYNVTLTLPVGPRLRKQSNMSSSMNGEDSSNMANNRPPFAREGSTCSMDSAITEIEALTDDELSEMKANEANEDGGLDDDECPNRNRGLNNWKKIRGMVHWQPFAKTYKRKFPWIQLAGHQGNFKAGEVGTILKKADEIEKGCLIKLMNDELRCFVPEYKREVESHEERYLVMQDLLSGFDAPSVMDCKMGVRTFLEDELEKARKNPKLRKDLYQKMIDIDPSAPTEEEQAVAAITKPRYMKWREELSSSTTLGFRIEGIKKSGEKPNKDFKMIRRSEEVGDIFRNFVDNDHHTKEKYLKRLTDLRRALEKSSFFKIHEVIGSSLLFVHDSRGNVNIWMIDFAKTNPVGGDMTLNHRDRWKEGNHEDGYLFGVDNMISIWSKL